jgi:hypothetical protein
MGSITGDASQRKQLLRAQIELERAELMVEIAQLRDATAPGQIARELFGSLGRGRRAARGGRGAGWAGWLESLLGGAVRSNVLRMLLGSGLLRTLFGAGRRAAGASAAPASQPGLLRSLLARYPLLSSAVGLAWPLLTSRRGVKRIAVAGVAGVVAWQAWLAWLESKSNASR